MNRQGQEFIMQSMDVATHRYKKFGGVSDMEAEQDIM